MPLVDLKRTREGSSGLVEPPEGPFFPQSLFFDESEIAALGIGDLELGDERELRAVIRVTSISARDDEASGKTRNMAVVLTKGEIGGAEKSQAERVFGGKDGGS